MSVSPFMAFDEFWQLGAVLRGASGRLVRDRARLLPGVCVITRVLFLSAACIIVFKSRLGGRPCTPCTPRHSIPFGADLPPRATFMPPTLLVHGSNNQVVTSGRFTWPTRRVAGIVFQGVRMRRRLADHCLIRVKINHFFATHSSFFNHSNISVITPLFFVVVFFF